MHALHAAGRHTSRILAFHRHFLQVNLMQCFGLALAVGAMIYNFVDKGKKKGGEFAAEPLVLKSMSSGSVRA